MAKSTTPKNGGAAPSGTVKPSGTKPAPKRKTFEKVPGEKASEMPAAAQKMASSTFETAPEIRTEIAKKELIERMVAQSDMKNGEARRAADATLLALASALRDGFDIAAAPLGKIKVTKQKDTPNGKLVVCRIKLKSPE